MFLRWAFVGLDLDTINDTIARHCNDCKFAMDNSYKHERLANRHKRCLLQRFSLESTLSNMRCHQMEKPPSGKSGQCSGGGGVD